MPGKLGLPELLLILFVALLVFGPSKLGTIGKSLGEGIRNFRSAVNSSSKDEHERAPEKSNRPS